MIINSKDMLTAARKGGYAVGAFNIMNLETARGVLMAAQETASPVVVQFTESTMNYAGGRTITHLIKELLECYFPDVVAAIHLDHGKSYEVIERAVEIGVGSVMYDGSRRAYVDNVATTKKVKELCASYGVPVQAELGNVPYMGEIVISSDEDWDEYMTDPDRAARFVEETQIDTLAVAIGNAHGFTRERSTPDLDRLRSIVEKVHVPLVLHGASDWDDGKATSVIEAGISCFNVDTATRIAFVNSLARSLRDSETISYDLRALLGDATQAFKETIVQKMRLFGCAGKSSEFVQE